MSWLISAKWNGVLGIMEIAVVTLCTWYFLSRTQGTFCDEPRNRGDGFPTAGYTEQSMDGKKRYRFGMFFLYFTGLIGLSLLFGDTRAGGGILSVFMVVMTMLIGYCLYDRNRIHCFFNFLFSVTMETAQIFVVYLMVGYMSSKWGTMIFDYYLANVTLIIKQLSEILLTGIWVVLLNRKKYEDVKGIRFAGLFLPPAVSVFIMFSLIYIGNVFMQMYGAFLIILDIFFLVFMNLYIWYLFSYQSKNKELRAELEIRKKQSEMQYQYYELVEQQYQSSRKMVHDMRNHLQAIETLKSQDLGQGREYMKDMHQMLDALTIVNYTDNRMLNIILNDKAKAAQKRGIEMDIRIGEIHLEQIRNIDITAIFANLLDNALEAAEKGEGERKILIRADEVHDFVVVKIQNTMICEDAGARQRGNLQKDEAAGARQRGNLQRDEAAGARRRGNPQKEEAAGARRRGNPQKEEAAGAWQREERERRKHMGIGLKNVRCALEKYGGGMMTEKAGDWFIVNITIPKESGKTIV